MAYKKKSKKISSKKTLIFETFAGGVKQVVLKEN